MRRDASPAISHSDPHTSSPRLQCKERTSSPPSHARGPLPHIEHTCRTAHDRRAARGPFSRPPQPNHSNPTIAPATATRHSNPPQQPATATTYATATSNSNDPGAPSPRPRHIPSLPIIPPYPLSLHPQTRPAADALLARLSSVANHTTSHRTAESSRHRVHIHACCRPRAVLIAAAMATGRLGVPRASRTCMPDVHASLGRTLGCWRRAELGPIGARVDKRRG